MSKSKLGVAGAFGLGFGLVVSVHKWWPVIKEKAGPTGKQLLAKGLEAADKAKDLFWEKSEKIADVISELKEEQEEKSKSKPSTEPETN